MARENYDRIMEHIFEFEGGYVDHPSDPGGATNMGITIGTLRDYRGRAVTKAEVQALGKVEAAEIYRRNYWDKIKGDDLPGGVDLCVMDGAVNSGPGRGARWLQRAIGATADGAIGPETVAKAFTVPANVVVDRMCDDRLRFLKGLKTWGTFGKGWKRRVDAVRDLAHDLTEEPEAEPAPAMAPHTPISQLPKQEIAEPAMVRLVQQLLREKGYPEVGNVDGKLGDRTRDAITIFQRHAGVPLTGIITAELPAILANAAARQVSAERATATEADIKDAKGVKIGRAMKLGGGIIAITSTVFGALDGTASFDQIAGAVTQASDLWSLAADMSPWMVAAVAGLAALYLGREQIADQVRKYRAGNHV